MRPRVGDVRGVVEGRGVPRWGVESSRMTWLYSGSEFSCSTVPYSDVVSSASSMNVAEAAAAMFIWKRAGMYLCWAGGMRKTRRPFWICPI